MRAVEARARKKPRGRYHHGDLRRALVDASRELIEAGGSSGLSLRAVARRLGVSHQAPLHHFADRQALLAAVAAEGFDRLAEATLAAARAAGAVPLRRLEATGVAYVRFAIAEPELFRTMFGPELTHAESEELATASARAFGVLVAEVSASLRATGSFDAERLHVVTTAAWSLVHGLSLLYIDGRLPETSTEDAERLSRDVTRLVARSLEP